MSQRPAAQAGRNPLVSGQQGSRVEIPVDQLIDEQRSTSLQIRVAAVCAGVAFCDSFSIQAVNYAGPVLRDALALTTKELGWVFSLSLLGMMMGSFCVGPVADRFGRRVPMAVLTLAFGLITVCTVFATEFWHLATIRLLDGLALGAALPNANVLTAEYSPRRNRRLTLGLVSIGYTVGGFVAGIAGGPLIGRFGWEAIFLLGGGAAVTTALAVVLFVPESLHTLAAHDRHAGRLAAIVARIAPGRTVVRSTADAKAPRAPFRVLLGPDRRTMTLGLWLLSFLAAIDVYFFLSWTPIVLRDAGVVLENAITITAMFNLGLIGASVSVGWLMDRVNPAWVILAMAILAGFALASMGVLFNQEHLLGPITALIGLGLGGVVGGVNLIAATSYPASARVTGAGWTLGIGRLGSVFGPSIGAAALSAGIAGSSIYLWAIVPAASIAVLALVLSRTFREKDPQ